MIWIEWENVKFGLFSLLHYQKCRSYKVRDNDYAIAERHKIARVLPSFNFDWKKVRINVKRPVLVITEARECLGGKNNITKN